MFGLVRRPAFVPFYLALELDAASCVAPGTADVTSWTGATALVLQLTAFSFILFFLFVVRGVTICAGFERCVCVCVFAECGGVSALSCFLFISCFGLCLYSNEYSLNFSDFSRHVLLCVCLR